MSIRLTIDCIITVLDEAHCTQSWMVLQFRKIFLLTEICRFNSEKNWRKNLFFASCIWKIFYILNLILLSKPFCVSTSIAVNQYFSYCCNLNVNLRNLKKFLWSIFWLFDLKICNEKNIYNDILVTMWHFCITQIGVKNK